MRKDRELYKMCVRFVYCKKIFSSLLKKLKFKSQAWNISRWFYMLQTN